MKIKYEATIDDFVEPHMRLFSRTKTYKNSMRFWTAIVFSGSIAVIFFLKGYLNAEPPNWLTLLIGILSGIGYCAAYPRIVRGNIKKHFLREFKNQFPCTATYKVADKKIICSSLNVDITFELSDLIHVVEDEERIELFYGPKGISVIPKRAFNSISEIDQFKNIIKSEQVRPGDNQSGL